jgi:hypothetical protein
MTIPWLAVPSLAVAFLAPALRPVPPGDEEGEDNVVVVYDLRPILPSFDTETTLSQALVPALADPWHGLPSLSIAELHQGESPDSIASLVTEALGEELHYEGRGIQIERGDQMVVSAPPAVQTKVRAILDALQGVFASSVTIELDWFSFPDGTLPIERCVLTQEEAKRFVDGALARGTAHVHQTLRLTPGRTAALDRARTVPFLADYDVEIAQGSFIYDPISFELRDGFRALLRATSVPGGTALSVLWLQEDLIDDVRERPVVLGGMVGREQRGGFDLVPGPASMQTADVMTHALAFDSFLPEGKALVAFSDVDVKGATTRQVLVLRRGAGTQTSFLKLPLSTAGRTLVVLDGELFGPPQFSISSGLVDPEEWRHPFVLAELSSETSSFLDDQLGRLNQWWTVGPWALALTDPAWDGPAAAELERLAGSIRPTMDLVELGVELSAPNGSTAARWKVPTLAGRSVGAVVGVTGLVLQDYDVEVAQFAAVSDPRLRPTFHGLCMGAEVARAPVTPANGGSAGWVLRAQGVASLLGATPTFSPPGPGVGTLEFPREERLAIDEHLTVPAGTPEAVVRIGPEVGEGRGLGVTLRVR